MTDLDLDTIETWLAEHPHFHSARKGDVKALIAEVRRLREQVADAWDDGADAGESYGRMPSMYGTPVNPYRNEDDR